MDEDGKFVNNDKVGELVIKSDHVMQGYWELPEETKKTFRNGWLLTGDLAKKDDDGFIYLLGRKKEMIISGGFNIYPREVEEVLYALPYIRESVVIGVESEEWGEIVVAFLVTKEEEYLAEIKAYCKDKLGFKKPKEYIVLNSLPKNATGKIDKNKLQKIYHNREKIQIG
jgi:fatty-acyl-CoA synthase